MAINPDFDWRKWAAEFKAGSSFRDRRPFVDDEDAQLRSAVASLGDEDEPFQPIGKAAAA